MKNYGKIKANADNRRELFIQAGTALIESIKQSYEINDFLCKYGIDAADYSDPAYIFLENFIATNFEDIIPIDPLADLFSIAEFGDAELKCGEIMATTPAEIYDYYTKR